MAVGMWLLSLTDVNTPARQTGVFIGTLGRGTGFLMQITMLTARNSVGQKGLGVTGSTSTFFRSTGGSFGVSLFGAICDNELTAGLRSPGGVRGQRGAEPGSKFRPSDSQVAPATMGP